MEEKKLICGSCNVNIADTEEAYLEKIDHQNGNWFQCFNCYCEEYEYIHGDLDED